MERQKGKERDWLGHWSRTVFIGAIAVLAGCSNNSQPAAGPAPTNSPTPADSPVLASPSPAASPSAAASPAIQPTVTPTGSSAIDNGESQVRKELETRVGNAFNQKSGVAVQTVTCPDTIQVRVGNRFECAVTAEGQSFAIAVELTSVIGPQFAWSTRRLLLLSELEKFIQAQIKTRNISNATVSCGGKIRTVSQGDRFECQVSNPERQERSVKVTVRDEMGNVDVSLI